MSKICDFCKVAYESLYQISIVNDIGFAIVEGNFCKNCTETLVVPKFKALMEWLKNPIGANVTLCPRKKNLFLNSEFS